MMIVLDASALLALSLGEPGAEHVADVLADAVISAVNLCEVLTRLADLGADPRQAAQDIAARELPVIAFDPAQAILAAVLRPATRHLGLSLGDRCCLALAIARKARVVTADRAWAGLDVGVGIDVIR